MPAVKKSTLASIARMTKGKAHEQGRSARSTRAEVVPPTPEQMAKGNFVEQDIVDVTGKGRVSIGKAYRRLPKFEKIEGLGTEQLRALRYYRATFDASEISEVKSALDIGPGGGIPGSHGAISRMEAKAISGNELRAIERAIAGGLLHTLRDVALMDLTFSDVAMKRFGARHVDYIIVGKGKQKPRSQTKLAPKSGAHRQVVRDEFLAAVNQLVEAVAPHISTRSR